MLKTTTSKIIAATAAGAALLIPPGAWLAVRAAEYNQEQVQYQEQLVQYHADVEQYNEDKKIHDEAVEICDLVEAKMNEAEREASDIATNSMITGVANWSTLAEQGKAVKRFNKAHAFYSDHCIGIEFYPPEAPVAPVAPTFL